MDGWMDGWMDLEIEGGRVKNEECPNYAGEAHLSSFCASSLPDPNQAILNIPGKASMQAGRVGRAGRAGRAGGASRVSGQDRAVRFATQAWQAGTQAGLGKQGRQGRQGMQDRHRRFSLLSVSGCAFVPAQELRSAPPVCFGVACYCTFFQSRRK